jgi:hypothetical protein
METAEDVLPGKGEAEEGDGEKPEGGEKERRREGEKERGGDADDGEADGAAGRNWRTARSQRAVARALWRTALVTAWRRASHWPLSTVRARFWTLVRTTRCSLWGVNRCRRTWLCSYHGMSA